MQTEHAYVRDWDSNGTLTARTPKRNIVEFFKEPMLSDAKTAAAGRPVFEELLMIRIIVPGDNKNIVERRAHHEDKVNYAREWEAYERQETLAAEGTMLEHWPIMTRGMVRTLKACNVFTVEHVAGLSDTQLSEIGILGGRTLRRQAQVYLESAKTGAVPTALVAENEGMKQRIEQLEAGLRDANLRYEALLREKGVDASRHEVSVAGGISGIANVASAAAIAAPADPEPRPNVEPEIPENWESLGQKETLALAEKLTGMKFGNIREARSAIREAQSDI